MGFLSPAALIFSALAIPIIIFYMLRLRRQPLRVSSLLLWQKVLQDRRANAPWQRIRRNLLLLLQLLILLLTVLALARPFRTVEAGVQGNIILLIDDSASMQATDTIPNRLTAAKNEAVSVIRALRPGDTVSVIAVADLPQPLLTGDAVTNRRELETAIRNLPPTTAAANWDTALALAAASAASIPNSTVVVITDGALPAELPALPVPVRTITVPGGAENQAIVALATRDTRNGAELFVRVENFADAPVEQLLEISVDGQLFDARAVSLAAYPAGAAALTFSGIPPTAKIITAQLTRSDALTLDNRAIIRRNFQGGTVLLVGEGNLFLERAFGLLPGLTVSLANPDNLPADTPFDLMVFDRVTPDALPENATAFLFIDPPGDTPLFSVRGTFSDTAVLSTADHPITTFTDFRDVQIAAAKRVDAPWAQSVLTARGGSLLLVGESNGTRVAILTFNLLQSDLPLKVDFPILIANLSRWLLRQSAEPQLVSGADTATDTNPLNAAESNIRPTQTEIRGAAVGGNTGSVPGQQEFWWLLAVGALGILLLEWWFYWRGGA